MAERSENGFHFTDRKHDSLIIAVSPELNARARLPDSVRRHSLEGCTSLCAHGLFAEHRGHLRLKSLNHEAPESQAMMLDDPRDREALRKGMEISREICIAASPISTSTGAESYANVSPKAVVRHSPSSILIFIFGEPILHRIPFEQVELQLVLSPGHWD